MRRSENSFVSRDCNQRGPQRGTARTRRLDNVFVLLVFLSGCAVVKADDGYRLWLRYAQLPATSVTIYRQRIKSIAVRGNSVTVAAIRNELRTGCMGLL